MGSRAAVSTGKVRCNMLRPRPFLIALQFLTALPIQLQDRPAEADVGRSLLHYPLVGLLMGTVLTVMGWGLTAAPSLVGAAIVLTQWVLMTGMLHLDGLADSADAWLGGLGDRDRTLAIMKDPRCGPAAVIALILLLLLKFAALVELMAGEQWLALALIPMLGRSALLLLFLSTPYVRPGGLGALLATHLPRRGALAVLLSSAALVLALMGLAGVGLIALLVLTFFLLRRLMQRRIGGTTGDTAGALLEITETILLLGWVVVT